MSKRWENCKRKLTTKARPFPDELFSSRGEAAGREGADLAVSLLVAASMPSVQDPIPGTLGGRGSAF